MLCLNHRRALRIPIFKPDRPKLKLERDGWLTRLRKLIDKWLA